MVKLTGKAKGFILGFLVGCVFGGPIVSYISDRMVM